MTYAARLIAGTIAVLFVTVVSLVIGVDRSVRRDLAREAEAGLAREAALAADALPEDSLAWQPRIEQWAKAIGVRITIVDRSGRVRAESDVPAEELARVENHGSRAEIAAALGGATGTARRTSRTLGEPFLYLAVPGGPGVVRVARNLADINAIVRRAQRPVLLAALLALLLGVGLSAVAARRFARPLEGISSAARAMARGEAPSFPYSGIPDIDRLTADLRAMQQQLTVRFDALRRRQSETAAMVDSMVEGVISSDARGHVTTANPAARRLLGFDEADELPELGLLFRGKAARDALAEVEAGQTVTDREVAVGEATYQLNARPLPTGGTVVVLHDLTRLKRLERVRSDFVANASHELKTPLTAISGYAETLLADEPDPIIRRRFLETILSNARRMQRLVDDQLDLSRIESGGWKPTVELVAVESAVQEAWGLLAGAGPHPRLVVMVAESATALEADPDSLRQLFRNLFENAIRHTPPGGKILVETRPSENGIELTVSDTGTGIPSEHLSRIFERFYRVDPSRSREQGGTGLGLSIVKHLVESHGGRVWATSSLGQGAAIHCWWPGPGQQEKLS